MHDTGHTFSLATAAQLLSSCLRSDKTRL